MMHIPKNAKLFLYEQLRRHSTLTQCSASPPFAPWAKVEPCQLQGWRRRGSRESRGAGASPRGSAGEPVRTHLAGGVEQILWLPVAPSWPGLGSPLEVVARNISAWTGWAGRGQGGLSAITSLWTHWRHPLSPSPSVTITIHPHHPHPVVNEASEGQKEEEEFGSMGRLSEQQGRGLQGEDPSPHFAAHENQTPSLQQGVKHPTAWSWAESRLSKPKNPLKSS